jgi:hypothetical protein
LAQIREDTAIGVVLRMFALGIDDLDRPQLFRRPCPLPVGDVLGVSNGDLLITIFGH